MAYEKGKKRKGTAAAMPCCDVDWEIEADMRALARAADVQKDPERLKKVKELAKQKLDESKAKRDEAQKMVDLGEGKDVI